MADRDSLTSRTLPFMTLSDGSEASATGPPPPLPHYLNAEGRALARFAVEGNIISKSTRVRSPNNTSLQDNIEHATEHS